MLECSRKWVHHVPAGESFAKEPHPFEVVLEVVEVAEVLLVAAGVEKFQPRLEVLVVLLGLLLLPLPLHA